MKIANTSSADNEDLENNDTADSNKAIKNATEDEESSHFGTEGTDFQMPTFTSRGLFDEIT
jgi:hypothetical protein